MIDILVKNLSTAVTDEQIKEALPDFQTQVSRDFAPSWGTDAKLTFIDQQQQVLDGQWLIGVFDTSDQAGALGYHDVTSFGAPLGKVFAKTTIQYGGLWTVTFSHELLEMLGDPDINLCALDDTSNRIYAYEACDAVEADELGYKIGSTQVSDFVLPSWFEPGATTKAPRSFCGHVKDAFELAPGGYISYLDFRSSAGWQQESARTSPHASYAERAHVGSRRERRRVPHKDRIPSAAK